MISVNLPILLRSESLMIRYILQCGTMFFEGYPQGLWKIWFQNFFLKLFKKGGWKKRQTKPTTNNNKNPLQKLPFKKNPTTWLNKSAGSNSNNFRGYSLYYMNDIWNTSHFLWETLTRVCWELLRLSQKLNPQGSVLNLNKTMLDVSGSFDWVRSVQPG